MRCCVSSELRDFLAVNAGELFGRLGVEVPADLVEKRQNELFARREKRLAQKRLYRVKNWERCKQAVRDWCKRNPEKIAAIRRRNRERNPDYMKNYRAAHIDKIREYQRNYYLQNYDEIRRKQREYYQKNRERLLAYQREYAAINRDKVAEYQREYRLRNKISSLADV